ncbi:hypothetical protein niasHT_035640 [Heterodera trifolii]|uniref:Uncharacterized protein n=1 Tax=Heterodera trifolii TaxID=157864 RepID=A0ABD2HVJ7_9BILA
MNPKRIPIELVAETVGFLRLNRRWGRCRVSASFDHFLLKKIGRWLKKSESLIQACREYDDKIDETIRRIPFIGHRINEASKFLIVIKQFAADFPIVRDSLPTPANDTLDEFLRCARAGVRLLVESNAVTNYDLIKFRGALFAIYYSAVYYLPTTD